MAITNSALPFILAKTSTVWPDNMNETDFIPNFDTLKAIQEQQTARVEYSTLPDNADAKITWMNNCDLAVDDYDNTDCSFTGPEADTYVQTLTIDQAKETKFSVPIDAYRGNAFAFADAVATNLNLTMKKQLETIAQYAIGVIEANLGTNTYDGGGTWTVSGTSNTVPLNQWDSTNIFGKFLLAAKLNYMDMPYLLSGQNLFEMAFQAKTNQANGEGKGDANRLGSMPLYNDVFNVESVNGSTLKTYMINKGALAFASKGYYPTSPEVLNGNFTRFQIRNRWFPQLVHDVESLTDCTSGVWSTHWKVIPRYKVFVNPVGCTATRTGMIALTKDASGI